MRFLKYIRNIHTVSVSAFLIFATFAMLLSPIPSIAVEQTTEDNSALLESIRTLFKDSFSEISAEIQELRNEVRTLRAELQQVSTREAPPTYIPSYPAVEDSVPSTTITFGEKGDDVVQLQKTLIRLGFGIPAGITGNFFSQTQTALEKVQKQNNLPVTGIFDQSTRDLLRRLTNFQHTTTPTLPTIKYEPQQEIIEKPVVEKPAEKPAPVPEIRLISPSTSYDMLINAGVKVPIVWNTVNAPEGSWVTFRIINKIGKVEQIILKTKEHAGEYEWTAPSNMASDNEFIAELIIDGQDGSTKVLASKSATVAILGGSLPQTNETNIDTTTTTTNVGSNSSGETDFYLGSEFTSCISEYPDTISLIHGWIDSGLTRDQFPWGVITGSVANKVAECERGFYYNDYIPPYGSCQINASESSCYAQPGCAWYGSYCGGDVQTYGDSASSTMSRCYYPEATINGEHPGYTVWCESDYQNCRVGDPSGASIAIEGLALGAPSACESGWSPPSNNTSNMQNCWYDNVSRNGEPLVDTRVWCESDYYNCHFDSPSGTVVTMDGLSLGAPSSCESAPAPVSTNNSFLSNTATAISGFVNNFLSLFSL